MILITINNDKLTIFFEDIKRISEGSVIFFW